MYIYELSIWRLIDCITYSYNFFIKYVYYNDASQYYNFRLLNYKFFSECKIFENECCIQSLSVK